MPAGTPNDATLNVPYPGERLGTGLLYFTCGLKGCALGGAESASSLPGIPGGGTSWRMRLPPPPPGTSTGGYSNAPLPHKREEAGRNTYSMVAEVKA